jgi:hypothetical protein
MLLDSTSPSIKTCNSTLQGELNDYAKLRVCHSFILCRAHQLATCVSFLVPLRFPHTVADGSVDRNELAMVFYTAGPTLSDPIELKLFALMDNRFMLELHVFMDKGSTFLLKYRIHTHTNTNTLAMCNHTYMRSLERRGGKPIREKHLIYFFERERVRTDRRPQHNIIELVPAR